MPFDLAGYFARVGYTGPPVAGLDVLRELHRLHPTRIAFENIDVLLGRPIRLDATALSAKLVAGGRGGYCYEHNTLFCHVLRALGFAAMPLLARVLWQQNPAQPLPRTHMLLRINLPEGTHIADVGFGACTPTAPLALVPDLVQQTPLESFRLLRHEREYDLQVGLPTGWADVYRFRTDPVLPVDCEPLNWFHSTCPVSPFTQHLIAARADPEARHVLRDRVYRQHSRDRSNQRQTMADGAALVRLLETRFMIRFGDATEREAACRRLDRLPVAPAD